MTVLNAASRMALAGTLFISASAIAVPIDTSGVWSSPGSDAPVANVSGVGTDTVSWGLPFGGGTENSSFNFAGVSGADAPLSGELFALGNFTHNNNPIFLPGITGATLQTSLEFTSVGTTLTPSFGVDLEETPNLGSASQCNPAPSPGNLPCPDIITIPDTTSNETITIDGAEYLLEVVGFSTDGGATVLNEFITQEQQPNTATLFARLVRQDGPVPVAEPNLLGLTGLALFGFGVLRLRRRNG